LSREYSNSARTCFGLRACNKTLPRLGAATLSE